MEGEEGQASNTNESTTTSVRIKLVGRGEGGII